MDFICKKCNGTNYEIIERGPHHGMFCAKCGRLVKWLSKDELNDVNIVFTNLDWLKTLPLEKFAYNVVFNRHTRGYDEYKRWLSLNHTKESEL